jgi:hypothetical protein
MSIALFSILAVSGIQYAPQNSAVARQTAFQVTTNYRSIEMAFGAYRMANHGAVPSPSAWRLQLDPYLQGQVTAPANMAWSLGATTSGAYACVSNAGAAPVSSAIQTGLEQAAQQTSPSVVLSKTCGASTANTTYDGNAALTFPLLAGG